jgi:hypothetical protein
MGRDRVALAMAIVSTKSEGHFSRSAGGYFAGMVRKDERGELHLERSLGAARGQMGQGEAPQRELRQPAVARSLPLEERCLALLERGVGPRPSQGEDRGAGSLMLEAAISCDPVITGYAFVIRLFSSAL